MPEVKYGSLSFVNPVSAAQYGLAYLQHYWDTKQEIEQGAGVIATDSGGIQKEGFFHSVPCVTLHEETKWVALVDLGWNVGVPPKACSEVYKGGVRRLSFSATQDFVPVAPYGKNDADLLTADHLASECYF